LYTPHRAAHAPKKKEKLVAKTRPHKPPLPIAAIAMAHVPAKVAVANAKPNAMPQATVFAHLLVHVAIAKPRKVQPPAKLLHQIHQAKKLVATNRYLAVARIVVVSAKQHVMPQAIVFAGIN